MSYFLHNTDLNVSRGLVPYASPLNLFGYNPLIGTSYVPAWENATEYDFPTEPLQMTVTSDPSDATAVIRIIGLDINYDVISEDVTLTASGSQTTWQEFFRINDVITVDNGDIENGNPSSDVVISNGEVTYAKIRGGDGRNQAAIYTVPRGHSFYLHRIDAFCASALKNNREVFFRNLVRTSQGVTIRVGESSFLTVLNIQRQYPFRYAEKSDIQFQLKASQGQQFVSVFGEGVLIKE